MFGSIEVNASDIQLISSKTDLNKKFHSLLQQIRKRRGHYMALRIIIKSSPQDLLFLNNLVEDKNINGESYVEYLCSLHRRIQLKLP